MLGCLLSLLYSGRQSPVKNKIHPCFQCDKSLFWRGFNFLQMNLKLKLSSQNQSWQCYFPNLEILDADVWGNPLFLARAQSTLTDEKLCEQSFGQQIFLSCPWWHVLVGQCLGELMMILCEMPWKYPKLFQSGCKEWKPQGICQGMGTEPAGLGVPPCQSTPTNNCHGKSRMRQIGWCDNSGVFQVFFSWDVLTKVKHHNTQPCLFSRFVCFWNGSCFFYGSSAVCSWGAGNGIFFNVNQTQQTLF